MKAALLPVAIIGLSGVALASGWDDVKQTYEPAAGQVVLYRSGECKNDPYIVLDWDEGGLWDDISYYHLTGDEGNWDNAANCVVIGPGTTVYLYKDKGQEGDESKLENTSGKPMEVNLEADWRNAVSSVKVASAKGSRGGGSAGEGATGGGSLGIEAPTMASISPNSAAAGQQLGVTIEGTGIEGASALSGSGVVGSNLRFTGQHLEATLQIDANAMPGARTLTLVGAGGEATIGFTVSTPGREGPETDGGTGGATGPAEGGGGITSGVAKLVVRSADSWKVNGSAPIGGWTWLRDVGHAAEWSWGPVEGNTREACINFDALVTNQTDGGSGFDATVSVLITTADGTKITKAALNLGNTFRPRFPGNSRGNGYPASGSLCSPLLAKKMGQGVRARIEWPPASQHRPHVAVKQGSARLTFIDLPGSTNPKGSKDERGLE